MGGPLLTAAVVALALVLILLAPRLLPSWAALRRMPGPGLLLWQSVSVAGVLCALLAAPTAVLTTGLSQPLLLGLALVLSGVMLVRLLASGHRVGTERWAAAWAEGTPCEDIPPHPYAIAKGETFTGCRIAPDGRLMIPRYAIDGEMLGGQWIAVAPDAAGRFAKRYSTGTPTSRTFYLLGTLEPAGAVLVCEGAATGATLHRVTGHPVVCAMDAGNLLAVCEALRDRYPDIAITVGGDDDRTTPGNPGRTKATRAASAVGARVAFPSLCGACRCTDFNDQQACERRRAGGA